MTLLWLIGGGSAAGNQSEPRQKPGTHSPEPSRSDRSCIAAGSSTSVSNVTASFGARSVLVALILSGCGGGDPGGGTASTVSAPPPASPPTTADATFLNPLRASGPDPYVIRMNGVYYYTQTLG